MNRRGQFGEATGPIQNLMLMLVVIAVISFGAFSFLGDLSLNHPVSIQNKSAFLVYNNTFADTQELTNDLSDTLLAAQEKENTVLDNLRIVSNLLSAGFGILLNTLISVPVTYNTIFVNALNALGLGAYVGFAYVALLMIVIFAILAIIMKVRA